MALVILRTGIKILRESSADLMDTVPGRSLSQQITGLLNTIPEVKKIEEIHAHRFGPYLVVNITIGLDGSLSVAAGDAIASRVEQLLYGSVEFLRRVYVHYHPAKLSSKDNIGEENPPVTSPTSRIRGLLKLFSNYKVGNFKGEKAQRGRK